MDAQSASAFFNEPTPLIPVHVPRKIQRAKSSMTCPECGLEQSVALDCAGCGRIMKPSTDFRLADPLLAPSPLESVDPVEAAVPAADRSAGEEREARSSFTGYTEESRVEGAPWLKMLLSLIFCGMAWDLNDRLLGLENAPNAVRDLPFAWELFYNVLGREGSIGVLVFVAAVLMLVSARQVLSGRD